ncbi:MAG: porin family protein [Prevotella sp.]|nr:porin family protein [Prevotella sp.]MBR4522489.1 porin family protein [Prevotella sp.]
MKKFHMSLVIAAFAMLMAIPTQAQVNWGLRAGANIVNMKMSSDVFSSKNNAGFYVGPTVKFTVPIVGLSFDASALYDQRTAKVVDNADGDTEERKQQTIQIPINIRYGWGLSSMANVFLFAGPQFGFNVSKHYSDWTWKSSQFSVNVGVGATVLSHLELKANYNFVVGKSAVAYDNFLGNSRFNSWQVGLGYYF